MMRKITTATVLLVVLLMGCSSEDASAIAVLGADPTSTPSATYTPEPTSTEVPTATATPLPEPKATTLPTTTATELSSIPVTADIDIQCSVEQLDAKMFIASSLPAGAVDAVQEWVCISAQVFFDRPNVNWEMAGPVYIVMVLSLIHI